MIPETVNRLSDGLACTNLVGYVERGWCCVQLLCVLHLGEPQALCASMREGCRGAYTMIGGSYIMFRLDDEALQVEWLQESSNTCSGETRLTSVMLYEST